MKDKKNNEKLLKEIALPEKVNASIDEGILLIKGPKGEVRKEFKLRRISIEISGQKIVLKTKKSTKRDKTFVGSVEAHIKNMVRGSMENHFYTLKICSGHFPMNVSVNNNKLVVKNFLGEKVPRILNLKSGVEVKVEGDLIRVTGPSKETAGQVSGDIEQLTRRPGYDGRVFQDGIWITSKDGEELK